MIPREDLILVAYESARDRFPVSFEEFAQHVCLWDAEPVTVNGQLVGAILTRGPHIHACIKPEGFRRWLSKGVLRRTLGRVIEQYGKAQTEVAEGNLAGSAFVERLGFREVSRDQGIIHYEASYGH